MTTQTYAIPPPTKKDRYMHIFRFVSPEALVCKLLGIKPRQLERMSVKQMLERLYGLDQQITDPNAKDAALQLAALAMQRAVLSAVETSVKSNPALAEHFLERMDDATGDWIALYNWLIAARDGAAIKDNHRK
ncbi:hypothetical protein [Zoogloea sp. 1C4]|uniref:hypothetical protein n=1 Tax=Zoogloea sp. 1C4 TaxID=2570190 RepID=UPI001290D4AD|nr:hypothetical protein [Zoogloea sp. 1C4]